MNVSGIFIQMTSLLRSAATVLSFTLIWWSKINLQVSLKTSMLRVWSYKYIHVWVITNIYMYELLQCIRGLHAITVYGISNIKQYNSYGTFWQGYYYLKFNIGRKELSYMHHISFLALINWKWFQVKMLISCIYTSKHYLLFSQTIPRVDKKAYWKINMNYEMCLYFKEVLHFTKSNQRGHFIYRKYAPYIISCTHKLKVILSKHINFLSFLFIAS